MNIFRIFIIGALILALPIPVSAQDMPPDQLPLIEALRHVYAVNPSLRAARAELRAAQELYPQAMAGWKPSAQLEGRVFSTHIDRDNFSEGTGATTKNMALNLEQPLFRGGRTSAETARARALIEAARANEIFAEQTILLRAAEAYLNVGRDRKILASRRANADMLDAQLLSVQERFKGGDLTVTDSYQAEARLARARSQVINAETALENSNATFEEIIGLAPTGILYYPDETLPLPSNLPDCLILMEKQNPELKALSYNYEAARSNIDAAFRELFPQISAFASYYKDYDPQPGIIDESGSQAIGVRAVIPLYEGGATRSRVRQAKNTTEQRRFQLEEAKRRVRAAVIGNWQAMTGSEAEIQARMKEIDAANLVREGIETQERLGTRTVLDTLDAAQDILDARTDLAIARRNRALAYYTLAAALGLLNPLNLGLPGPAFDAQAHLKDISHKIFSMETFEDP